MTSSTWPSHVPTPSLRPPLSLELLQAQTSPREPPSLLITPRIEARHSPMTVPYSDASSARAPEGMRQTSATSANTSIDSLDNRPEEEEDRREDDILRRRRKERKGKGWVLRVVVWGQGGRARRARNKKRARRGDALARGDRDGVLTLKGVPAWKRAERAGRVPDASQGWKSVFGMMQDGSDTVCQRGEVVEDRKERVST